MIKRLIITLDYPPARGGIASYVLNFAAHLPPDEIVLYAPVAANDREFDSLNLWPVYRLNPYFLFWWPRWLALLWQAWGIVKLEGITELHVHQALPVGYVAYILKKLKKIPYTLFLHGTDIKLAMRWSKRVKFAKICRAADRIVVNSQFLKTKLESRVDGLASVQVLYPGPGDAFFKAGALDRITQLKRSLGLNGKKVLLTVTRLHEGKGLPHLARLLPRLIATVPNLVWVIVGDGPKFFILQELVKKSGLESCVRLVGAVDYIDLPIYYQSADVFALLTHPDAEAEEGWGTVFLEAAASGLPVVAGAVGGVEEAVENGVTGLVVDVYQETAVYNAIVTLLTDSQKAESMGAAGQARALEKFNWTDQLQGF